MAITKKQKDIAELLKSQFTGKFTYEELFSDTLTGVITWLTVANTYFAWKNGRVTEKITAESTAWTVIDILMNNLLPEGEIDSKTKWYIIHYERYCKNCWQALKMLLDHIKKIGGKEALIQIRQDEKFKEIININATLERIINNRLKLDGLEKIEQKKWSEEV